jgi:prepilin-type N-terminal cleavage/methylation domain-containing protein
MTSERAQRLRNRAGYSLIELMTAVSVFGVLAASGLPHIDTRRTDLDSMQTQVIADLRWARTRAITSGVHYRLVWSGHQGYEVQRMKQNADGTWSKDVVVKTATLPDQLTSASDLDTYEFNTRGMMVSAATQSFVRLTDARFGSAQRQVEVWPSGQVQPYYG